MIPLQTKAAAKCPGDDDKPKVELRLDEGEIRYDYGRDRRFLAGLLGRDDTSAAADHVPIGLTRTRLEVEIATRVSVAPAGQHFCAYLRSGTVRVGFKVLQVFIERKYRAGSCEFTAILDHEMEHVAIHRRILGNYRYLLEARVAELTNAGALVAPSAGEAKQKLHDRLRQGLAPTLTLIQQEAKRRHAILDSPASYAKTRARCSGW